MATSKQEPKKLATQEEELQKPATQELDSRQKEFRDFSAKFAVELAEQKLAEQQNGNPENGNSSTSVALERYRFVAGKLHQPAEDLNVKNPDSNGKPQPREWCYGKFPCSPPAIIID